MGASDAMEVFSIYGQAGTASAETSRCLVKFPVTDLVSDRNNTAFPASGSVSLYLRMFNAEHGRTLPRQIYLNVAPISKNWQEGTGLDMESYSDLTYDDNGANWINAGSQSAWDTEGGDYSASFNYSQYFDTGIENVDLDITPLVVNWIRGDIDNYGVIVSLSGAYESTSRSYYTKKFFTRGSEYWFKRPIIEARWNSSILDDRAAFYVSSSMLPSSSNLHRLYLYNYFDGELIDIPYTSSFVARCYTSASGGEELTLIPDSPTNITRSSTGVYFANFALNTTASKVYDVWINDGEALYTSSFNVKQRGNLIRDIAPTKYALAIDELKPVYTRQEEARFHIYSRQRNWQPNIYLIANQNIEIDIIKNLYFKLVRVADDEEVISYGTGSDNHTLLSYDISGSYFDLDMAMLESDYMYELKFLQKKTATAYKEVDDSFKFRVE